MNDNKNVSSLKRKVVTSVCAWRDREEFQEVYELIYGENADILSKEQGRNRLAVWKIRCGKDTPPGVLATLVVLEVHVGDFKSQLTNNINDIRSMYAGAFTKYINLITDPTKRGGIHKRGTMKTKVADMGMDTFIVDLRHLCAHSSMTISIDVFRRSAEYCMTWMKSSFWDLEREKMQGTEAKRIKLLHFAGKHETNLEYIFKVYDIATKALHKGARGMDNVDQFLTPNEKDFLKKHAVANSVDKLMTLIFGIVNYLGVKVKHDTPAICEGILSCRYMLESPAHENTERLAETHQMMFQILIARGCIQFIFERYLEICEDVNEKRERRLGAKFWATQIAQGFRNLKKFKNLFREKDAIGRQFNKKEQYKIITMNTKKIYLNILKVDARNSILIGTSADCPWSLGITKAFVLEKIRNVNEYTAEIVITLLVLVEPSLRLEKRQKLLSLITKFTLLCNNSSNNDDDGMVDPLKNGIGEFKFHTVQDVISELKKEQAPHIKDSNNLGIWNLASDKKDWKKCPLGSC